MCTYISYVPSIYQLQLPACIFSSLIYQLLVVCHILTTPGLLNSQDGLIPLMLAAQFGNLSMAKLLVQTYRCDVNEKSDKVSGNYT